MQIESLPEFVEGRGSCCCGGGVGKWRENCRTSRVAPRSRAGSFPTGDELQIRNPLYLTSVQTLSRRSDTDRTPAQAHEVDYQLLYPGLGLKK